VLQDGTALEGSYSDTAEQESAMNPTYGIVTWLVIAALVGWLGSRIMGTSRRMRGLATIGAGVAGAMVGSLLTRVAFGDNASGHGLVLSALVALVGTCGILGVGKVLTKLP
jgi:uncharacterized membrane protein YeaQ/YmgE (transglycosylase-associated protein family)